MIFGFAVIALLGFLAGHFAQEKNWSLMAVTVTGALVFYSAETAGLTAILITFGIAGGLAYLLERRGKEDTGAALIVILTSALVFYYTGAVVTAIVFASGTVFLVRRLVKGKKKNWLAYIGTGVGIGLTLILLSLLP